LGPSAKIPEAFKETLGFREGIFDGHLVTLSGCRDASLLPKVMLVTNGDVSSFKDVSVS